MTQAITLNHFPGPLKKALIHPVPKEQVGELRRSALLSHLAKVLELLITWQLRLQTHLPWPCTGQAGQPTTIVASQLSYSTCPRRTIASSTPFCSNNLLNLASLLAPVICSRGGSKVETPGSIPKNHLPSNQAEASHSQGSPLDDFIGVH